LKEIVLYFDGQKNTGFPFITKENIRTFLTQNKGMSEENVRKNLQENNRARFLGALIHDNLVRAQDGGYVVLWTEDDD